MKLQKMTTEPILQLLENGQWHYLKDISKLTSLNNSKVEYITEFLIKYDLVKLDETKQKIKLDSPTTAFLKKMRQLENEKKHKSMF